MTENRFNASINSSPRAIDIGEFSARNVIGSAIKDLPPLLFQLANSNGWLFARNRGESITLDPEGPGIRCNFKWSSGLHVARVFPPIGAWIMRRAFAQWPVHFAPPEQCNSSATPDLSFIIPFRGTERLPQLLATVCSIFAQTAVKVECIVIEQSNTAEVCDYLPPGVRYIHLPHPEAHPGWRKSWAYNVAARHARAPVLVCHDADVVVPEAYGTALLQTFSRGFDSVHIQRFLFYLNAEDSQRVINGEGFAACVPLLVSQNWVGGTLGIKRDVFFTIGGFDERFVDWGGEDNEFFDRCRAIRQCTFGFVPFVHLWHPEQSTKNGVRRDAALALMESRLAIPPAVRIDELRRKLASS